MLWGLISSAFVIYLYRSLKAAENSPVSTDTGPATSLEAAVADLDKYIDALEVRTDVISKGVAT